MNKILFLISIATGLLISSCEKGPTKGYSKTKDGLYYKLIQSNAKTKAKIGDWVSMHVQTMNTKDSLIFSTYKTGKPYDIKLIVPQFKGDLLAGIPMLGEGDSALFLVNVDSLYKGIPKGQRPPMFKDGFMKFTVKMIATMDEAKYMAKKEAAAAALIIEEELKLSEILKQYPNIKSTESGLKYNIEKQGNGKPALAGKKATLHYTGKLLNGKIFDSSVDRGTPFSFVVGQGQVIKGWDEGVALLKEGSKATFIIPAKIGYGMQEAGPIPAGSTLLFDVELLKVEDAPKQEQNPMFQ